MEDRAELLWARKTKAGYEFKAQQQKVNHLLFMDDLKLYEKDESQISSITDTVYQRFQF